MKILVVDDEKMFKFFLSSDFEKKFETEFLILSLLFLVKKRLQFSKQ